MKIIQKRILVGVFGLFLFTAILLGNPTLGFADGDADGGDSEILRECQQDSDCGTNEVCKDDGVCVTYECDLDSDCDSGYHCREDKICAPDRCSWDVDCLSHELCIKSQCIMDPSTYVEGGAFNCQTSSMESRWEQIGAIVIGGLLLLWFRIRRRDA